MSGAPLFTIVIPTHARPAELRACLEGIARLDFDPAGFEVVVVDDGARSNAQDVAAAFRDRFALRVAIRTRGGPAAARNLGVAIARGRYLVFVDDDCVPAPYWLSAFAAEIERTPDALIGGPVTNALPDNPFSTATELIAGYVRESAQRGGTRERFFTTNNLAVPADRFRDVGGFDVTIPSATAEDKELCDRWLARGWPMVHAAGAVVHHAHVLDFRGFLRQHYQYGRGILYFRLMRVRRGGAHFLPERPSFYAKLLLHPLRAPRQRRAVLHALLVLAAQLATAAGALRALALESAPADENRPPTGG